jgi:hypothetical protein
MKAPSECNRPLRHGSELDAVSCAWARELAVLRAMLVFGLKKPRQRFEAMANWRRWPSSYAVRRPKRHAPDLSREGATLIALAQSASVGVAIGERLHQAAQMKSCSSRRFWILAGENPPFSEKRTYKAEAPHVAPVFGQLAMSRYDAGVSATKEIAQR